MWTSWPRDSFSGDEDDDDDVVDDDDDDDNVIDDGDDIEEVHGEVVRQVLWDLMAEGLIFR